MDSNFSVSLMPTLHYREDHRLGRIHRKEDIQPLRETRMECSVGDVFMDWGVGAAGLALRSALCHPEDNGQELALSFASFLGLWIAKDQ